MSAWRISSAVSTVSLGRFDVVGKDGSGQFIEHVGLAAMPGNPLVSNVSVIDMGPPLRDNRLMSANVVGTAHITADEQRKIKTFIDRHESEHQALQKSGLSPSNIGQAYCILPSSLPFAEADGRYTRTRFSCAGFVLAAYKSARIQLIDEGSLPTVDLAVIQQTYPVFASLLNRQAFRGPLGLAGSGPWPVLLCGYLLHALKRNAADIRQSSYTAQRGDEIFM